MSTQKEWEGIARSISLTEGGCSNLSRLATNRCCRLKGGNFNNKMLTKHIPTLTDLLVSCFSCELWAEVINKIQAFRARTEKCRILDLMLLHRMQLCIEHSTISPSGDDLSEELCSDTCTFHLTAPQYEYSHGARHNRTCTLEGELT